MENQNKAEEVPDYIKEALSPKELKQEYKQFKSFNSNGVTFLDYLTKICCIDFDTNTIKKY